MVERNLGMTRSQRVVVVVASISLFMLGCVLLPQSPYRQALPITATDVKEYRSGTVDFEYLLRARMTEDEFRQYVHRLGLNPVHYPPSKFPNASKPKSLPQGRPDWWRPIHRAGIVYELRKKSDIISAKYEAGFLYLSVFHI